MDRKKNQSVNVISGFELSVDLIVMVNCTVNTSSYNYGYRIHGVRYYLTFGSQWGQD